MFGFIFQWAKASLTLLSSSSRAVAHQYTLLGYQATGEYAPPPIATPLPAKVSFC